MWICWVSGINSWSQIFHFLRAGDLQISFWKKVHSCFCQTWLNLWLKASLKDLASSCEVLLKITLIRTPYTSEIQNVCKYIKEHRLFRRCGVLLYFKYLLLQHSYVFRDTLSCLTRKKKKRLFLLNKSLSITWAFKVIYLYICKADATNTFVLYLDSVLQKHFIFSTKQKYDRWLKMNVAILHCAEFIQFTFLRENIETSVSNSMTWNAFQSCVELWVFSWNCSTMRKIAQFLQVKKPLKKPLKIEAHFFSYKIEVAPTDFKECHLYCTVGKSAMIKIKINKLALLSNRTKEPIDAHAWEYDDANI